MQAAAAAAAEAAARRGAEAAQRQAHRQELRQREEAQALQNLRAFKDSIKAAVSRVSHPDRLPPPPPPPHMRHPYCLCCSKPCCTPGCDSLCLGPSALTVLNVQSAG